MVFRAEDLNVEKFNEYKALNIRYIKRKKSIFFFESIKMVTKFNKYKQKQFVKELGFEYEKLIQRCENEFGDREDAEYEVEWYVTELMNIYYNGGKLYRIVMLPNKNKLNKEKLGNYWVTDEGILPRVIGSAIDTSEVNVSLSYIFDNEEEYDYFYPFVITALVKPKSVDIKKSLSAFKELPLEGEIYVDNAKFLNIKEYKKF